MDFRFVAYDPQTGTKLYQLPRATSVSIGDTFGTRGTLELTYSAKAVNARDLPTFLEVQAEVTFDEGDNWAPAGPSLLRLSGEHEDTDQAGMRTLRFVGREWVLGKARVGNGDLELIDGKRPFYRASPGQILRTLILEAQDRGAADGIEIGNFTAAKDSSGKAWAKVATIYYSPGLPIGSVLENLVEQGMCDYRMDGRTIHLYNPETTMGRDLTTGNNPVRVHGAVTEAPVKYTLEDLANSALLMGDEGFELEVDNPTAPDDYGRLEVTIEQGGVSDSGTARLMVDEALHRGSREVREITRSQSAAGAAFLPFRDYRVGDYVQVHTGGAWERYRVREIQLARDGDEWTIHTIINDRLQELLLKLAKRTSGIVNGSKGSGGDGTRPTPPEKPGIEPAAPEGLVIDQQVYLDRQGVARGQITAGWGAVTESTKGQAVEIGGYELWWRRNETQETWTRVAVTDGSTSVNHSPVVLTDTFGNAMEYQWRVRAIAEASTRPGPFSDIVTLTMTQDTDPPNAPSLPTVETDLRIVTVDWDGLDESAEAMPVDYNHTRIYFAPAEDMVGAERVGSLTQPGMWNSGSMDPDVPVWVAVSAVDHVGNESAMTPAQSVTPRKLVDDSSIRDELTGIDDKINSAVDDLNQAIDNIVVDDAGIATYWMPTEPDETTDPPPKAGFLWFDTSTAGKNKLHRFDGASWVSAADQRIDTIGQAQDDLEADVNRVRTSVDGKNAITQSTSTPPKQYDGAEGDVWEIMSSMGSGGRSVSRWRWNSTVWVSNLIGDTVLGNVDAAKIGTGYLSADRIEAASISAEKVLIGSGQNLVPWGQVEREITVSPHDVPDARDYVTLSIGEAVSAEGIPPHIFVTRVLRSDGSGSGDQYVLEIKAGTPPRGSTLRGYSAEAGSKFSVRLKLYSPDSVSAQIVTQLWTAPIDGAWVRNISHGWEQLGPDIREINVELEMPSNGTAFNVRLQTSEPGRVGVVSPRVAQMTGATLIEDGAITTDKIATGAITAESGIIADLDAGTIKSGIIDADRIGANTITGDKLLIGEAGNIVPFTPGSENIPYSDYGSGTDIRAIQNEDGGAGYVFMGGNGTDGSLAICAFLTSSLTAENGRSGDFTVTPGETISARAKLGLSGWGGAVPAGADVRAARIRTAQYDQNGTYIDGTVIYGNTVRDLPYYNGPWSEVQVDVHESARSMRVWIEKAVWSSGSIFMGDLQVRNAAGATLIEDGAITTDKILANAITAGKIAALAIEADHISANAITADKINAGAIDGKLITGARIRTAASGARVELNSEGLKAYRSNGAVVLNTDTSDGSIDMTGRLSQTIGDRTITVGGDYGGGPGIIWSDSNIYVYPPGVRYGNDPGNTSVMTTLVQGPGTNSGNSYLDLVERGDGFDLRAWKGTGSSRTDWRVDAEVGGMFRVGSSMQGAPSVYMKRGATGTGYLRARYEHPSLPGGNSTLSLEHAEIYLSASDSKGDLVSRLWGDADSTELNAGSRSISIKGKDHTVLFGGKDSAGTWTQMQGVANRTMSGFSKVIVAPNGAMGAEGSSRRFKVNIEAADASEYEDALLSITPKTWQDRIEATQYEEYLEWRKQVPEGPVPEDYANSPQDEPRKYFGAIAEDFEDAGLGQFVGYDEYGRPNALAYDRIGPALIPIIKRLRDRVDALETKLGETA